jgi:hypothetical protein
MKFRAVEQKKSKTNVKYLVSRLQVFLIAAFASIVGASLVWVAATSDTFVTFTNPMKHESLTPGMDLVDSVKCETGQRRIVEVRGREDGFSRDGEEPARIDPRLLADGYYRDFLGGTHAVAQLRDYDEQGSDKVLLDYFELPPAIASLRLVFRYKTFPGFENDAVQLGDLFVDPAGTSQSVSAVFVQGISDQSSFSKLADGSRLVVLNPVTLKNRDPRQLTYHFGDFLKNTARPNQLDVSIGDDTSIDFAALITCQEPLQQRGVTFAENHSKMAGPDVSWLSCNNDQSLPGCDPLSGDQVCSIPTPLGCYRPGTRKPDRRLMKSVGPYIDTFAGGEIRITEPVPGNQFATLDQANAFCRQHFGDDWRVLSYHEGGAGGLITYSKIASKTRLWIDIRDQRRANCWDRNQER